MNASKRNVLTWIRTRWKKVLFYTGVSVGALVAVLLVVYAVLVWITGAELEMRIQALRVAGAPVTFADLAEPVVPPDSNAADFLRRAEAEVEALNKQLAPLDETLHAKDIRLSEMDQETLRAIVAAHPRFFSDLEKAAACPNYHSELDFSGGPWAYSEKVMLPRSSAFRGCIGALRARTLLRLSQERFEEAMQDCLVIFQLAHHYEREPFLINFMVYLSARAVGVENANRVLRSGSVSAAARSALAAELARHDEVHGFQHALVTERVFGLEASRDLAQCFLRAQENDLKSTLIDMMNRQLELAELPYAAGEVADSSWESGHWSISNVLARLGHRSIIKTRASWERSRAQLRCLRVLLALLDQGEAIKEPKITDLGLPPEVITDPFSGRPLRLKKSAAGWTVYSVGPNGVDDGGDLTDDKDVGVGPPGQGERGA